MRGLRNNNPLNIRNGESRWKGMEEQEEEKEFVCFLTLSMGYRAAWILLRNYRQRLLNEGKSYTLGNIIERWAPPEDGNDSKAYVRNVLRQSGWQATPAPTRHRRRQADIHGNHCGHDLCGEWHQHGSSGQGQHREGLAISVRLK